jgi:UDP-N-acetylglucosamine 4-epimerase
MSIPPHSRYHEIRSDLVLRPQTWLITGVAGFIGSNLLADLLALGQTVVGLDNYSTGHRRNVDEVLSNQPDGAERFRMIEGDIRHFDVCRDACTGVDYVLHQAALGSVPRSIRDPLTSSQVNVDGFLHMLVAARDARVKRMVYASSSSVYGDATELPQSEERTGRVLSPYAATKASNEMFADVFQRTYRMELVGLRYFNVFGARQDPNGAYAAVIPRWAASLLCNESCHIYGDGETSRDFCYIANVVQANLLAAAGAGEDATGKVYNIACGRSTSLRQLFYLIRDALAANHRAAADAKPVYDDFRPGDLPRSFANIDMARRMLGYEPTHELAAGLAEALPWYTKVFGPNASPCEKKEPV